MDCHDKMVKIQLWSRHSTLYNIQICKSTKTLTVSILIHLFTSSLGWLLASGTLASAFHRSC